MLTLQAFVYFFFKREKNQFHGICMFCFTYSHLKVTIQRLKYCRYGVKHYPINQSINQSINQTTIQRLIKCFKNQFTLWGIPCLMTAFNLSMTSFVSPSPNGAAPDVMVFRQLMSKLETIGCLPKKSTIGGTMCSWVTWKKFVYR